VLFQTLLVQMLAVVLVRVINVLESAIVHLVTIQLLVIAVLKSVLVMVPAVLTVHVTLTLEFVSAETIMLEEHVQHLMLIVQTIVTETDFVTEKQENVLAQRDSSVLLVLKGHVTTTVLILTEYVIRKQESVIAIQIMKETIVLF